MKRPFAIAGATLGLAMTGCGLALWSPTVALVATGLLVFIACLVVEIRP